MFKIYDTRILLLATLFVALMLLQCTKEYSGAGMPEVKTLEVSGITTSSAQCGGEIVKENGFPVLAFGLLVSEWDDFRKQDSLDCTSITDGKFEAVLTGLKYNQILYLKAWATNELGAGYGKVVAYTHQQSGITFNPDLTYDTLVDIDGNRYLTIQIGTQQWMAENLKTTTYNDGTPIPHVVENADWNLLSTPAYSWYMNSESDYKATYGAMYNWWAVASGKLCPLGWHAPDSTEYSTLVNYLGGSTKAGTKLKEQGNSHWLYSNLADNSSGFTALPGGYRTNSGVFLYQGNIGYLWSTTPDLSWTTRSRFVIMYSTEPVCVVVYSTTRQAGLSVRCVKD
jgi:uncharacterized protein (TIGR02145 family)